MWNSLPTSNPSPDILWLAGYINHDELTPLPALPGPDPVAHGLDHTPPDHHVRDSLHVISELFELGTFYFRPVPGFYRYGHAGTGGSRLVFFQHIRDRFIQGHLLPLIIRIRKRDFAHLRNTSRDDLIHIRLFKNWRCVISLFAHGGRPIDKVLEWIGFRL